MPVVFCYVIFLTNFASMHQPCNYVAPSLRAVKLLVSEGDWVTE